MNETVTKHIIDAFRGKEKLTKQELVGIVREADQGVSNEKTIGWRIFDLKQKGLIKQLSRGIYGLPTHPVFKPEVSDNAKAILDQLEGVMPDGMPVCVTETGWLNEWMTHQVFTSYILIEPEKVIAERVFRELQYVRDHVYYDPDSKTLELQLQPDKVNIIVKPVISEAPVEEEGKIMYSTLEKILVDLVCDTVYEAQAEEADEIYRRAIQTYMINLPRLRRYARRRSCEGQVNRLLHDPIYNVSA